MLTNALHTQTESGNVCKLFGVRLVTNTAVVQLAHNAGYDALFIDLEHSTLSINDASQHCMAALQVGMAPFVRVPYQCGNGFVQKVMDGGAMGVVFPHMHNQEDAEAAVSICKYPPLGKRSMTGQLPIFSLRPTPVDAIVAYTNAHFSSVILMIETADSIQNIEEIASVEGVDALLIGSNDLAIELGVPGQFKSEAFRSALETVSAACRKYGKIFGIAGIYDDPEIHSWALNTLGARLLLVQQDSGLIAGAGKKAAEAVNRIFSPRKQVDVRL